MRKLASIRRIGEVRAIEGADAIEALFAKEGSYTWTYKTDIPHETFEIVEDGEPYCRGIVFSINDLK